MSAARIGEVGDDVNGCLLEIVNGHGVCECEESNSRRVGEHVEARPDRCYALKDEARGNRPVGDVKHEDKRRLGRLDVPGAVVS
jgi:hypothetical protein